MSIGLILFLSSCRKFVEINPAPNLIETNAVFLSDKTALSAISGVYTQLRSNTSLFTNGGLSINAGLAADEIYATAPNISTDPFFQNQLTPNTTTIANAFYNPAYRIIYQTNAILEGLAKSKSLSDSLKNQLTGEMKTVRSLLYFYLVNLFGDVPLIISSDYLVNATLPRSPVEKVYQQIVSDLTDAQNLLKPSYPSAGKMRINKWTATALLSRVYLYQSNWTKAEAEATSIIQVSSYILLTNQNINNVFLKNSSETIWEVASSNDAMPPGEAILFIPASTTVRPAYALTSFLLDVFEFNDARKTKWLNKNTVSGIDYWYPFKYKQRSVITGTPPNENQIVLRLAEQYLIRAEARAQQNNLQGAKEDLNTIRTRAGLLNTTAITKEDILAAITKERQVELMTEWGHRWLDLKRTNKADAVISAIKGTAWQTTDALWPLPQNELYYNPNLVQNPGY